MSIKDDVKSVLRIGSAHNNGGLADINIAQISHLSNFSVIKFWFIFIYEHSKPEKDKLYFRNMAVQNVNKGFVYIMDFTASLKVTNLLFLTKYVDFLAFVAYFRLA